VQSWQLFLSLIFDIGNKKVLRIDYAAFMVFVCNMLLQLNNLENSSVTRKKGSYSCKSQTLLFRTRTWHEWGQQT